MGNDTGKRNQRFDMEGWVIARYGRHAREQDVSRHQIRRFGFSSLVDCMDDIVSGCY